MKFKVVRRRKPVGISSSLFTAKSNESKREMFDIIMQYATTLSQFLQDHLYYSVVTLFTTQLSTFPLQIRIIIMQRDYLKCKVSIHHGSICCTLIYAISLYYV